MLTPARLPASGDRRVARFFAWGSLALARRGDDLGLKLALVQADADPVPRVRLGGVRQRVSASVESDGVPPGDGPHGDGEPDVPLPHEDEAAGGRAVRMRTSHATECEGSEPPTQPGLDREAPFGQAWAVEAAVLGG